MQVLIEKSSKSAHSVAFLSYTPGKLGEFFYLLPHFYWSWKYRSNLLSAPRFPSKAKSEMRPLFLNNVKYQGLTRMARPNGTPQWHAMAPKGLTPMAPLNGTLIPIPPRPDGRASEWKEGEQHRASVGHDSAPGIPTARRTFRLPCCRLCLQPNVRPSGCHPRA